MSTLPQITEQVIRGRVGERSFKAGKEYADSGAVHNPQRQGLCLKARCKGSRSKAYRVAATFDVNGLTGTFCSCPLGSNGRCKHVAALLLTWRAKPETFAEVEELAQTLANLGKEELIALIEKMLLRQPDLEALLEMTASAAVRRLKAADPDTYQRQAAALFARAGKEQAAGNIAEELPRIKKTGDDFLRKHDYAGAAAVYEGICTAMVPNYEPVRDPEGVIVRAANECISGLGQCLANGQLDAEQRQGIWKTLFDLYRLNANSDDIGLGEVVPALVKGHATAEEHRNFTDWIRNELTAATSWGRSCYGSFLIELEADTLDDEAFLRLCREIGHQRELVQRLLQRGRLEEAIHEAEQAEDHGLLELADLFVQQGQDIVAEHLVRNRARTGQNLLLLGWLKNRHAARGKTETVLELAEEMFRLQPSLLGYQEIRQLAQVLHRWKALRSDLITFLKKTSSSGLLIAILLEEGEIDQALEAVQSEGDVSIVLAVAQAAEKARPRGALTLYRKHAETLIQLHSRESYRSACYFLEKVRDLYHRLGENGAWAGYVTELREQHRSLRILQEELTAAKL